MSDQSEPREQTAARTEQVLETKDLEARIEEADQVRGGQGTTATTPPPPKEPPRSRGLFEVTDWGFDP